VMAHAPVGPDPHEVIASTDGTTAYVSIYGGGAYHTISVIDLVSQKSLPDIDLGVLKGPHGLDFGGGKLWFTAEGSKLIGSYNPALGKVDWVMGTGQNRTHMIRVMPGEQKIFTTNVSSGTVSTLEYQDLPPMGPPPAASAGPTGGPGGPPLPVAGGQRKDWVQTVIPVGPGAEGFDLSPDGRELWTANAQDGTISVIDVAGKRMLLTINAGVFGANRLKFTADGKYVLIASLRDGDLVVMDAGSRSQFKRVKVGTGAAGILVQPDGARAFVACTPDNYVAVVDLKTFEVTGHIDAGKEPDGMAWAVRR